MIEIREKKDCSGCYSCYNICPKKAIKMIEDKDGFRYPVVDEKLCIKCGLCEKVCPIINKNSRENNIKVYVCYSKNNEIRSKSSSGGIFTLIATEILNRNGVVFGAAFNKDFSVSHKYVETIEELDMLRTSKYLQSIIGDSYIKAKEFLWLLKMKIRQAREKSLSTEIFWFLLSILPQKK